MGELGVTVSMSMGYRGLGTLFFKKKQVYFRPLPKGGGPTPNPEILGQYF